jgi:hypothetical protein
LAAVAAWAVTAPSTKFKPRAPEDRPALALLSSLPLIFGESFGLEGGGSPTLTRLEQRYVVVPIGIADRSSLRGQSLLLIAHPRAQPAEVLVELDQWVRQGGRLVLLADPKLDWPSHRPFGDRLRPPPAYADTGLLAHWGLQLRGPEEGQDSEASNGEIDVKTPSPGRLESENCKMLGEGFVARCRIGKGEATIIADADFLNVDEPGSENLELLLDELARLESR